MPRTLTLAEVKEDASIYGYPNRNTLAHTAAQAIGDLLETGQEFLDEHKRGSDLYDEDHLNCPWCKDVRARMERYTGKPVYSDV